MRSIQITRSNPFLLRRWTGFRRLRSREPSWRLLFILWAVLSVAFAFLPGTWVAYRGRRAWNAWASLAHRQAHTIGDRWVRPLKVAPFTRGDEPALVAQLAEDPLVRALVAPAAGTVWLREGDRLRPAIPGERVEELLAWAREAAASGEAEWRPTLDPYRFPLREAVLLLPSGPWQAVKCWRPESPEVERFLEGMLGDHPRLRFGLQDSGDHLLQSRSASDATGSHLLQTKEVPLSPPMPGPPPGVSAGLPPWSLQVPLSADLGRHGTGFYCLKRAFGWGWMGISLMTAQEETAHAHRLLVHRTLGWLVYALWLVGSVAALMLFRHGRHQERLEADRLASLTHSLKTPLTILKLRCDTVRSAELPREAQEATLLQIGEEVDQLVRLIECGLERRRPKGPVSGKELIGSAFFAEIQEELLSTFQEDGRELRLSAEAPPSRAPALALKSALATLLENALLHGRGPVTLASRREGRHLVIRVEDEGPGLPPPVLEALEAKKVQALAPERKGRGQGLGLFLLSQQAEREGWGLRFEFAGETGFSATLEVPV